MNEARERTTFFRFRMHHGSLRYYFVGLRKWHEIILGRSKLLPSGYLGDKLRWCHEPTGIDCASWQQCCKSACQIYRRHDHSNTYRDFVSYETWPLNEQRFSFRNFGNYVDKPVLTATSNLHFGKSLLRASQYLKCMRLFDQCVLFKGD